MLKVAWEFWSEKFSQFAGFAQSMPKEFWLHSTSDLLIAGAYLVILICLVYFVRARRDLRKRGIFILFSVFALSATVVHALDLWTPWFRLYDIQGYVKLAAALFALTAAVLLWKILPKALLLPSPRAVRDSEERWQQKIRGFEYAEEALKKSQRELERLVDEKTKELQEINQALSGEVSERKDIEKALRKSEEYFRALIENALDMTFVLDRQGMIRYHSPSVRRALGFTAGDLAGKNISDFLHSDNLREIRRLFKQDLKSLTRMRQIECRVRDQNGKWRVLEAVGKNLVDDEVIQGFIVNARDITERKRAENEMRLLPEMMEEINRTEDSHSAIEVAVRKVCEMTDWQYGEAWIPRLDQKVLECSPSWYGPGEFQEYRNMSKELRFFSGMGMPGRVWELKKPIWIREISDRMHSYFTRINLAREFGLQSALGVPVLDQEKVIAVLVFFTREPRVEDQRLEHLISTVAAQIGSVIRRRRAEEALREAHENLERRIKERTKELEETNNALQHQIMEREQAEVTLRRAQENYLKLVNSLDGIVWEFDLENKKFTFVSEQAERVLGYPVQAWHKEPVFWQEHIHGADREAALAFRSRVIEERKDLQCEYRMVSSEGKIVWLRDMVTVVVDSGKAVKLRGVMVDVTERRQVEEALHQERNFASAVLDTAGALVMILKPDGMIENSNRACEQISGYPISETKGKPFWEMFSVPEESEKIRTIHKRLLAGQYPTNYESVWVAKDGNRRAIAWTSTLLNRKDGVADHIITTGIDITKRREVERELKKAVRELARSNEDLDRSSKELMEANSRLKRLDEMKSQFIFAASHELKTPLTSMKGFLETILAGEAGELQPQQSEFLGFVKDSADRLHRLLNELLDISKMESGQLPIQMDLTSLGNLLKEEMTMFRSQAEQKNLDFKLDMDAHLRDIYCDADKIKEVMDNLISNAIKYTPASGEIRVSARNHGQHSVEIEVRDTGIGIEETDIVRIFEPFQHIPREDQYRDDSTGLGLTLAKKIVEAHRGEIRVTSQMGKGSSFKVILPRGEAVSQTELPHWSVMENK